MRANAYPITTTTTTTTDVNVAIQKLTECSRLRWVTWIAVGACGASMALCPRLWISERSFPVIPLFEALHAPSAVHWFILGAFLGALAGSALWTANQWTKAAACLLAIALVTLDQSRLQPWLYVYMLILTILACRKSPVDDRASLGTLRLLFAFIYAYSAAHKLNASFFFDTGPLLFRPLARHVPASWPVDALAYPIPVIELAVAVLLLVPRTRRLGVALALAMHGVILLLIGPLGLDFNTVVWPWNVAMGALVCLIFCCRVPATTSESPPAERPSRLAAFARLATIIIAGVVPVGGVLGWLDRYISWGMYGGAPTLMAVWMNPAMEARLPLPLTQHVQVFGPDRRGILILDWSMRDLNVSYPEYRVMRRAAETLAQYVREPGDARVDTVHEPTRWTRHRARDEVKLEPRR